MAFFKKKEAPEEEKRKKPSEQLKEIRAKAEETEVAQILDMPDFFDILTDGTALANYREAFLKANEEAKSTEVDHAKMRLEGPADVIFCIDRSGSMRGTPPEIMANYNKLMQRLSTKFEGLRISTLLYDNQLEWICKRAPVEHVPPLSYDASGGTAMYDAIIDSCAMIDEAYVSEGIMSNNVLFVVIDDDGNNAGRQTLDKAREELTAQIDYGRKVLYLSYAGDAIRSGRSLGIPREWITQYGKNSKCIEAIFDSIYDVIIEWQKSGAIKEDWNKDIVKYLTGPTLRR